MNGEWRARELRLDGATLRYVEAGEGEPVVLLHGYPQSHLCWRHQIGPLAQTRRVIAPDWLGWGASDRNVALSCEYDAEVDRLMRMLDGLGLASVDLWAHDYGGFLSLGLVIRSPQRVRRFAICNSRAHRTFPQPYYAQFALLGFLARRAGVRALLTSLPLAEIHRLSLARYVRMGCFDAGLLDRYVGWMGTPAGKRWFAHFFVGYPLPARPELAAGLDGIRCPTAVIWGDRDPYNPFTIGEELAARIPHATLHRITGADHYVMEERPAEVLAAVRELLTRPV